jgi:hypothetical protein
MHLRDLKPACGLWAPRQSRMVLANNSRHLYFAGTAATNAVVAQRGFSVLQVLLFLMPYVLCHLHPKAKSISAGSCRS